MALDLKKEEMKIPEDGNKITVGTLQMQYTEEEEKRVIRKIDCAILPMVRTYTPTVQVIQSKTDTKYRRCV